MPTTVFSKCTVILATVLASVSIMTASATRCATDSLLEGTVVEISSTAGGIDGVLGTRDWFGRSVTGVGDVDGNGAEDMVVGASLDDDLDGDKVDVGAAYLLLMEDDGSGVKSHFKISSYTTGKFTSNPSDQFGKSVDGGVDAKGGRFDVDNDGMWDLVVGARRGDGDGKTDCGAVYVVFMNDDGNDNYSVREVKKISHGEGGLGYSLATGDFFGTSVAVVGTDLNNPTIAVGARASDGGRGAVYVLGLNTDGSVKTEKKIGGLGEGGLQAVLEPDDRFGEAMTAMDLTGDGVNELVVSALYDDDGYEDTGAVYVLSLDSQGGVTSEQKISATQGGLSQASLESDDNFGSAVTELGDLDGDGVVDLAVGALADDDGSGVNNNRGAVHVLLLNSDGSVKAQGKVSTTAGGFDGGPLGFGENFGSGLAKLGEKSANGVLQLAVGARNDVGTGTAQGQGAVYVLEVPSLFVNPCESNEQCVVTTSGATSYNCVPALDMCESGDLGSELKIASGESGFVGPLSAFDGFGRAIVCLGDVDKDGVLDMAVGSPFDGGDRGAVYILFMNSDGTVKGEQKISSLGNYDRFAPSVAALGDLDEDGVVDMAVGAVMDDDGGSDRGAVYIVFLNADGTVKGQNKISSTTQGGLVGINNNRSYFGASLAAVGDLDGDGVVDLAVGAVGHGGTVYILFLKKDGSVSGKQKISATEGGLVGPVTSYFGGSVAGLGDLDQDGVLDLAVGIISDTDGGVGAHGAVYILFLHDDGSVRAQQKISATQGGMQSLGMGAWFGSAVTSIGDLDGDGVTDLAVGARKFNDPEGGVVILLLKSDGTVKAQQVISSSQLGSLDGAQLGMALSVWGDGVLNADGMVDLAVGAPYRAGNGAGTVYMLGVPPGFVPVCHEACSSGDDSSYTCSCTTPGYELDEDDDRTCDDINECDDETTNQCEEDCTNTDGGYTCSCSTRGYKLDGDYDCVVDMCRSSVLVSQSLTDQTFGDGRGVPEPLGDLDGDGVDDFAVGSLRDDDGGRYHGAVFIRFMNANGSVKKEQKISSLEGGLTGPLTSEGYFGVSVTNMGDLDKDGVVDLAVGTYDDKVYILFLEKEGTVKAEQQISATDGGLVGPLEGSGRFGGAVEAIGDLDGDGVMDLAVGDYGRDGDRLGEVYILLLTEQGTVKGEQKISSTEGGLVGPLRVGGGFGFTLNVVDELGEDGVVELAVGSVQGGDVYVLGVPRGFIRVCQETCSSDDGSFTCGCYTPGYELAEDEHTCVDINECDDETTNQCEEDCTNTDGGYTCSCSAGYELDGDYDCVDIDECDDETTNECEEDCTNTDGGYTCSCSTPGYELDGDYDCVDINECDDETTHQCDQDCTNTDGGYTCSCRPGYKLDGDNACVVDMCRSSVLVSQSLTDQTFGDGRGVPEPLGDLDGDGVDDFAVGSLRDDDGGRYHGAVFIRFMNANGSVKKEQKISSLEGGLTGPLTSEGYFGVSVTNMGDLDKDGVVDLAVGTYDDKVYILFLEKEGTVKAEQQISATDGGLVGPLEGSGRFGGAVEAIGDLDGDGVMDLAVGDYGRDGDRLGEVYILLLTEQGTVKGEQKISSTEGGLVGPLRVGGGFGFTLNVVDELGEDGVVELAVGSVQGGDVYVLGVPRGFIRVCQETCSSDDGSFTCGCYTPGYELAEDEHTCVDINECDDETTNQCEEDCTNTDGGYTCSCSAGYELDGDYDCVDIDECDDETTNECEEDCTNTDGGYTCSCSTPGYELDGDYDCVDINECDDETTHQCDQDCTNTDGGYTCSCRPGYKLDGDNDACVVDMCRSSVLVSQSLTDQTFGDGRGVPEPLGDLDGDGVDDFAVGSLRDDDGGRYHGAVFIRFMNANGSVKKEQKISSLEGGLTGPLTSEGYFGVSVTNMGDLDKDGVVDLAVGTYDDKVYILFLEKEGTVKAEQQISATDGGLVGPLEGSGRFGGAVEAIGDLDGDGVMDLAVGDYGRDGDRLGEVYILLLTEQGTVKGEQKISSTEGGLVGPLRVGGGFGFTLNVVDELGEDGVVELAVGSVQGGDVYVLGVPRGFIRVCQETCSSDDGSFTCGCYTPGYGLAEDGYSCVEENGCESGTRAGFTDESVYPDIAACDLPGGWTDLIHEASAQAACSPGFHVCRYNDASITSMTYTEMMAFGGCYAYDTANDCGQCHTSCSLGYQDPGTCLTPSPTDPDIAGVGSGCTTTNSASATSCAASGRIDSGRGCNWTGQTGVVCCRD